MSVKVALGIILIAVCPSWVSAAVADSGANGFVSKVSVTIKAPPQDVYQQILRVGDWWDPAHTFSGNAKNLSIEERPMGCFCEKLADGGGVRHMEVVNFVRGRTLVMSGALGPMQSMAAAGNMSIQLSVVPEGTKVDVTYAVTGYSATGMNTLAAPVDGVVGQQFARLRNLMERGSPDKAEGR